MAADFFLERRIDPWVKLHAYLRSAAPHCISNDFRQRQDRFANRPVHQVNRVRPDFLRRSSGSAVSPRHGTGHIRRGGRVRSNRTLPRYRQSARRGWPKSGSKACLRAPIGSVAQASKTGGPMITFSLPPVTLLGSLRCSGGVVFRSVAGSQPPGGPSSSGRVSRIDGAITHQITAPAARASARARSRQV